MNLTRSQMDDIAKEMHTFEHAVAKLLHDQLKKTDSLLSHIDHAKAERLKKILLGQQKNPPQA